MTNYLLAIVGAILILAFMIELLRRRQLSEKYAALWLLVTVAMLILLAAPGLLSGVARILGFELPANLLFLLAIILLLGVAVHLSYEVSRLEDETRSLAEDLALLRAAVEELRPAVTRESQDASRDDPAVHSPVEGPLREDPAERSDG